MKIVDTRGQSCPAPLIATRKALNEANAGESFNVITGSRNAVGNISKFLNDNDIDFSVSEEEGCWKIIVTKSL